jgi:hypothetical protein
MTNRNRYALIALSVIGLAASVAALYVHYQIPDRLELHE